ncbi:MAG: hypothetical protein HYR63_10915 [Proteobacteria bacterium]|nr:hypothetical protein [Pseudomonadota bacterium]MBI3498266.1 hypothetical protein [Pseudomonadota bacterium]
MVESRSGVMITKLFENDSVRVEKIALKAGARTGFHGDGIPYTMIACTPGRTVRFDEQGKFLELLYLEPGLQWRRSASFAHDVMNVSDGDVFMLKVFDKRAVRKKKASRGKRP